jgi:hypothetical protein
MFIRPRGHVGITEDHVLRVVASAPAPLGGITLDRARREFDAVGRLWRHGGRGLRPVRLYRHRDGQADLAVVVSAAPVLRLYRADVLLADPAELTPEERIFVNGLLGGAGAAHVVTRLAESYGRALRDLVDCGLFRHSGSVDNWAVDDAGPEVYLTDLDSTERLERVSDARRPLEVLRDLASGVFNLAAALMAPGGRVAGRLTHGDAAGAFGALCAGFLPEVADVREAVTPFLSYWWPLAERSWAHGSGFDGERTIWMDRDLAFCLLMTTLLDPLRRGGPASTWGSPDPNRFASAAAAFLGPMRYARLTRLMAA